MTGITRRRAAEVVAEMFGTRAVCDGGYYGVSSVTDRKGREKMEVYVRWQYLYGTQGAWTHGSVPEVECSTEMVSPKLSYGEMGKLQEVVRCLRHHGAKVKCVLRAACTCGRFQPHSKKPQKCHDHHVFQRGYPVSRH